MLDMDIPMGAKWINISTGKLMERAEGGWKEIPPPEINLDGCATQAQAEREATWLHAATRRAIVRATTEIGKE